MGNINYLEDNGEDVYFLHECLNCNFRISDHKIYAECKNPNCKESKIVTTPSKTMANEQVFNILKYQPITDIIEIHKGTFYKFKKRTEILL